jgi:hypothetical protein
MLAKHKAGLKYLSGEHGAASLQDSFFNALVCPGGLQWQVRTQLYLPDLE